MNKLKSRLINLTLCLTSIVISSIVLDAFLRFLPSRYGTSSFNCPGYLIADSAKDFDIVANFPKTPVSLEEDSIKYEIWSNELKCFDTPYNGDKDYLLLVGDSFTMGLLPFKDHWGTLLENVLGVRVLKGGVFCYGTSQELLKAKEIISKVQIAPKLIIVGYCVNDLADDYQFLKRHEKEPLSEAGFAKIHESKVILTWSNKIKFFLYPRAYMRDFIRGTLIPLAFRISFLRRYMLDNEVVPFNDLAFLNFRQLDQIWELQFDRLRDFKELAAREGAKLLVVIIPAKEQVYPFLIHWRYDAERPNKTLNKFLEAEGISHIDLLPELKNRSNQTVRKRLNGEKDLYLEHDGHWSARGEYLVHLLVARYILRNNLIYVDDRDGKLLKIENIIDTFR